MKKRYKKKPKIFKDNVLLAVAMHIIRPLVTTTAKVASEMRRLNTKLLYNKKRHLILYPTSCGNMQNFGNKNSLFFSLIPCCMSCYVGKKPMVSLIEAFALGNF